VLGWVVFATGYAGLAMAASAWVAVPLMLLVAVAYGIAEPAERALVAALSPDGRQGASFGWYTLVQGVMALPAGLVAGSLWDRGGDGAATSFAVTAGLSLAAAVLLAATCRSRRAAAT